MSCTSYPFRVLLLSLLALLLSPPVWAKPAETSAPVKVQFPAIRQLFFAESEEAVLAMSPNGGGAQVAVHQLPLFDTPEFLGLMKAYIGTPISDETIGKMAKDIATYVRSKDRLTANLSIPKQDATQGTLRFVLKLGRYKDIVFKGNRWFSSKMLADKLGVKPGDEIRVSQLEQGVNWANTNPFRKIQAIINNVTGDPTRADLVLAVQERIPLRLVASYDNGNVKLLGEDKYTAAIQYANLWGMDHQVTYQYVTANPIKTYQAHSLDYRAPLPWHHYIQFVGAYASVEPVFGGGLFHQKGQNVIADLKYILPYAKGDWDMEFTGGIDFKQANNNLEFGGMQFLDTKYDVLQAAIGATIIKKDKKGNWSASLALNISPGGLTPRNQDSIFNQVRMNSDPSYVQATLSLQRNTALGKDGWEHSLRGYFQTASKNLVGSEQMSIGGNGTVRGYEERIFSGDMGYVFTSELLTPVKHITLPKKWLKGQSMQIRALAFWDCGEVAYLHRIGSDIHFDPLMSSGIGLRMSAANRISISADYGWRWKRIQMPQPGSGRGHIRVTMAF